MPQNYILIRSVRTALQNFDRANITAIQKFTGLQLELRLSTNLFELHNNILRIIPNIERRMSLDSSAVSLLDYRERSLNTFETNSVSAISTISQEIINPYDLTDRERILLRLITNNNSSNDIDSEIRNILLSKISINIESEPILHLQIPFLQNNSTQNLEVQSLIHSLNSINNIEELNKFEQSHVLPASMGEILETKRISLEKNINSEQQNLEEFVIEKKKELERLKKLFQDWDKKLKAIASDPTQELNIEDLNTISKLGQKMWTKVIVPTTPIKKKIFNLEKKWLENEVERRSIIDRILKGEAQSKLNIARDICERNLTLIRHYNEYWDYYKIRQENPNSINITTFKDKASLMTKPSAILKSVENLGIINHIAQILYKIFSNTFFVNPLNMANQLVDVSINNVVIEQNILDQDICEEENDILNESQENYLNESKKDISKSSTVSKDEDNM